MMNAGAPAKPKRLEWIGSSKKDLKALPQQAVHVFGYALYLAQIGQKHQQAQGAHICANSAGAEQVKRDFSHELPELAIKRFRIEQHKGFSSLSSNSRRPEVPLKSAPRNDTPESKPPRLLLLLPLHGRAEMWHGSDRDNYPAAPFPAR